MGDDTHDHGDLHALLEALPVDGWVRDETELWSFEGTPAELAQRGFNLFEALELNVS